MHYLLICEVVPDYIERRTAYRAEHLRLAQEAFARSELILGGALADPVDGAVLVFRGDSPEAAENFARSDPYVRNGLVTKWRVRKWTTVVPAPSVQSAADALRDFAAVVRSLRDPRTGCPWDLEQDHRSLRRYLIEEAHEVLDAIDRGIDGELRDELGDLLLQIFLHAQVAEDRGAFTLADVARRITEKMIRRHPHVFGDEKARDVNEVKRNWERIKSEERGDTGGSEIDRIPLSLPALARAHRLGKAVGLSAKPIEHIRALWEELSNSPSSDQTETERRLGDVLFEMAQWARTHELDAEDALRAANRRVVEHSRES
jgi:MazG family protein